MQRMHLVCLVALGASLHSAYAELVSGLDGECPASGGNSLSLLQHHARHAHPSSFSSSSSSAFSFSSRSSRDDDTLLLDEGAVTVQDNTPFYAGYGGLWQGNCTQSGPDEGLHLCGCRQDEGLMVRSSKATTVYMSHVMWRPVPSETVLNIGLQQNYLFGHAATMGMLPSAAFNPALLRLPEGVAASWHPDAYYVAVMRHEIPSARRCKSKTEKGHLGGGFEWTGSNHSSVMLLNKKLEMLVVGQLPVALQDYRFFSFKGKVLIAGDFYDNLLWSTRVFEFGLNFTRHLDHEIHQCPRLLNVVMHEFKHHGVSDFDHKTSVPRFSGKNFGFISSKEDGELQVMWKLTNPVDITNWTSEGPLMPENFPAKMLRNNGNPIYLPEYDAYLAFGHAYWSGNVKINMKNHPHVRHYLHRTVLFEAKPPYKWLRASNLFCFPAISELSQDLHPAARNEWCESIQFIMSWFREGDDILITYGVSDCEPAVARVPLEALEATTSTNFSEHPQTPHDAHAEWLPGL